MKEHEILLRQAAAEKQERQIRRKSIKKYIGFFMLVVLAIIFVASIRYIYQSTSTKQFLWLMVMFSIFGFLLVVPNRVQRKYYPDSEYAKQVFRIIGFILFVGLALVGHGINKFLLLP